MTAGKKPAGKKPAAKKPAAKKPADLDTYLRAWNGYPVTTVRHARCTCNGDVFALEFDDAAGAARRTCVACKKQHLMFDSEEYWDEAEPDEAACPCGNEAFQIAAGFAFYADSKDVRWIYVALRCVTCGQIGVYTDWKIDYGPSHQLLDQA